MNGPFARLARLLMLALMLSTLAVRPAFAQADSGPSVLRDTETELLFKQMSTPLIVAAGLDPRSVNVVLLNDPEINAFVATGQTVYVQSGLLEATDNVNQLQGVVAHELGHVIAGDAIRSGQGAKEATGISILSLVLAAAAIAAGAGDAAMGVMMAGQQAALGNFLAFTRAQEATADATGSRLLSKAGISGKGMLDFFAKLQNQEYRLASCRTRNIAWRSIPRTASTGITHCRRSESRRSSKSSRRIRPGASKPTRRSKRGSSG